MHCKLSCYPSMVRCHDAHRLENTMASLQSAGWQISGTVLLLLEQHLTLLYASP